VSNPGRQEAELLSKLHHPHVVRFYGVCYYEGDFYIVTEFCENTLQASAADE
jgi:serine/threonine protein kinase